jgi:hypothetical protein
MLDFGIFVQPQTTVYFELRVVQVDKSTSKYNSFFIILELHNIIYEWLRKGLCVVQAPILKRPLSWYFFYILG